MSADSVVSKLQELAEVLQTQRTLSGVLAGIAEAATTTVRGCDASTIAISIEGRPATTAATARVALELGLVQYDIDDGPCLRTFRNVQTVRIDLSDNDQPFPHFAAQRRGVKAVLSVPATRGDSLVATLNLYSRTGPFDDSALSIGQVLAAQAGIGVSRSPEFVAARAVVEQAQRDADDHTEVNVASGLLMVSQGCTAEQAAGLLRQAASGEDKTILEIAHRIIEQHLGTH